MSVFQSADTLWEAHLREKPQPRGCRQTPGTIRHSRAYLFNRMCYSITASLSQQQSFKYPFVFGIRPLRTIEPVCVLGYAESFSLWFTDTEEYAQDMLSGLYFYLAVSKVIFILIILSRKHMPVFHFCDRLSTSRIKKITLRCLKVAESSQNLIYFS